MEKFVGWSNGRAIVTILRPTQYIKNLLIIAAPIGAAINPSIHNVGILMRAFLCFCLISSAGYVLNDWLDREKDRFHEAKKERPFAAGILGKRHLILLLISLIFSTLIIAWNLNHKFQLTLFVYFALTATYSLYLKVVPIVEFVVVSIGFFIRALAGALVFDVQVSQWFLIVIGFSSLYLISIKRLSELQKYSQSNTRPVMSYYSEQFLSTTVGLSITSSILSYTFWVFEVLEQNPYGKLTVITVLIAFLRYQLNVERNGGEKPEKALFSDKVIPAMGALTLILLLVAIY